MTHKITSVRVHSNRIAKTMMAMMISKKVGIMLKRIS
jgi:hypothetical protein